MAQRRNPVILTIDDEENIRGSFRMFLEDYDYQILEAKNGQEGLEVFYREKPDLVICDLRMPEIDGLEVIEKIKNSSPDTPIIVVSGTGIIGDAIEAINRGAWNYLLKPIQDMSVLLHAINQATERSRLIIENRSYQEHLEEEVTKRTRALQKAVKDLNYSHRKLKNSEQKYRIIFDNLQDVYLEVLPDCQEFGQFLQYLFVSGWGKIHFCISVPQGKEALLEQLRSLFKAFLPVCARTGGQ
jgi:DNA-binding NtrC family response regulator